MTGRPSPASRRAAARARDDAAAALAAPGPADHDPGAGGWYEHALYYDVWFGWDPARELAFLEGAARRFGLGAPRRALEPFCGTGRLLRAAPWPGVGFDLSPGMVRFAARRAAVFRADAARFAVAPGAFDLAYCLIDSFRHLLDEAAALGHLACVSRALAPGGVYVLGLDVSGGLDPDGSVEAWAEARGDVRVDGEVRGLGDRDPIARRETMAVTLRVKHGRRRLELASRQALRTYTPGQLAALVAAAPDLEPVACFDRRYDLRAPVPLERARGSVVLVLRRT